MEKNSFIAKYLNIILQSKKSYEVKYYYEIKIYNLLF